MPHTLLIPFVFVLGACVGSFLNVVIWRLPREKSLVSPGSHCPRCGHPLAWRDNIPVFGWIILKGRCRYCSQAISLRYPIVEFITGALFATYYVAFFIMHVGPCAATPIIGTDALGRAIEIERTMSSIASDWPMYTLYMFMIAALLAVSLIDAELFIIPPAIPWLMAAVGIVAHAIIDRPTVPGAVNLSSPLAAAMTIGGAAGLTISLVLWRLGKMPVSFADGEPALEIDLEMYEQDVKTARREGREPPPRPRMYTRGEIRREIGKECAFLLPPALGAMLCGLAALYVPHVAALGGRLVQYHWTSGLLGALLGAMVGGLIVWMARILGTLAFGRVAMGLGDVDLMFGVGAVIGAGAVIVAFFLAPFAGLVVGVYRLLARGKWELPYGPYLALATAAVLLIYCPIANYFRPGLVVIGEALRKLLGV